MTSPVVKAPTIPEQARYDAERRQWEMCALVDGVRHGPFEQWRVDGSRSALGGYEHGKLQGKLQRFHPNGELAWEGSYVAGHLQGEIVATACLEPTPERLRECCVPTGAWQMRTFYEQGRSRGDRFFDREGRRLLSDGTPYPDRPERLPSEAWFEEGKRQWVCGARDEQRRPQGEWRWWFVDGTPAEVGSFSAGKRSGAWRTFSAQGQPLEIAEFRDGVRDGPFTRYAVQPGELMDERVREISGHVDQGVPIGDWEFRDADGTPLKRIDLGALPTEDGLRQCGVFLDAEAPPTRGNWGSLAATLSQQRQLGAGLCAWAREAAHSGSTEALRAILLERTAPLSAKHGTGLLKAHRGSWPELVHLLARGTDPADTLRALASAVAFSKRAARDFLEAGLLMAGRRPDLVLARALNRLEFGDVAGALADAEAVAGSDALASQFVQSLARVLFAPFELELEAIEPTAPSFEELPDHPAQPLSAVNAAVTKCALRLMKLRGALQQLYAESKLEGPLPPDLTHLVQDAGLELGHWQFTIEEEGESIAIEVDERLQLDTGSAVALMSRARVEWTTLRWLCWGAGLQAIAQPRTLKPPASFNQALGRAVQRYWRCKDQAATAGLRSRRQGAPDFSWQGIEIGALAGPLLQMASNEYLEQRAILFWLADEQCQSPWQDDLRPA